MSNKKEKQEQISSLDKIIDNTFAQLKNIVDANTVVGSTIKLTDKIFIVPISKISVGLISGGGEDPDKKNKGVVGAGSSTGFTITPIGFISINDSVIDFLGAEVGENSTSKLLETMINISEKFISRMETADEK